MRSFAIIKPSRNDKITRSFTEIGKTCLSREFLMLQICLLMLFVNKKFSRKFLNLQLSVIQLQLYLVQCYKLLGGIIAHTFIQYSLGQTDKGHLYMFRKYKC